MRLILRPRLTLLTLMLIVAVFAGLFAIYAGVRRQRRIAALMVQLANADERVAWAVQMNRKHFVSDARLASEERTREHIRAELDSLGALPKGQ